MAFPITRARRFSSWALKILIKTVNNNYNDYEISIESLKFKIFWKDKPIYLQQLKKWELTKLQEALDVIGYTEIMMKKNSQIRNEILIKNLLVNLCTKVTAVAWVNLK